MGGKRQALWWVAEIASRVLALPDTCLSACLLCTLRQPFAALVLHQPAMRVFVDMPAGVKNAMVVALDDDTKKNAESFGLPAFRMDVKVICVWWVAQ